VAPRTDLGVAAQLMRNVVDDPAGAARLGADARRDLAVRFAPEVVGARMRERLEDVWRDRRARSPRGLA